MECPKCQYERQAKDAAFVAEGECPRCGIVYKNYLRATVNHVERSFSAGGSESHGRGNEGKGGRTLVLILAGVVLCGLAFYAVPLINETWNGLRWETFFKQASDLYAQKHYKDAAAPAKRALDGAESKFGPNGIELTNLLVLLGNIHGEMEEYPEAVKYLERLQSIQEKTLGETHEETIDTIRLLVTMYEKQGTGEKAKPLMGRLAPAKPEEQPAELQVVSSPSPADDSPPGFVPPGEDATAEEDQSPHEDMQTAAKDAFPKEAKPNISKAHQVELYVTNWCPYCKKAVDFFRSRGIPFTAYDIEKDTDAARRKNQLDSRRGVPFAIIDGQHIHGYLETSYIKALEHK
ncbi:MAG: tetratricopeptide repeat protein [Deltaproteobacteria bacterium]|nr:tetratricopeptide repeat protein [Deltaproteobacteria bacterium]